MPSPPQRGRPGLRDLSRNWLSYAGAAIAALAFIAFVFLLLFHILSGETHAPYAGLVIFVLVPAFLLFGLLLFPVGMFFEWRRWKRNLPPSIAAFPTLDLNDPRQRRGFVTFALAALVFVFLSVYGSYEAYVYTESVEFCGGLCHTVHAPEHVTYGQSPHAQVSCVDCHVGPGPGRFARAKLRGVDQAWAMVTDAYPRPIPAALDELRPPRVICQQCHWPEKFFGARQRRSVHFLADERNTRWKINMLVKTGSAMPGHPQTAGIHWHMNPAIRIEYRATGEHCENIPWVRLTDLKSGRATVYTSGDSAAGANGELREMDCMDCHNRPTHIFRSPDYLVDLALASGSIDPALPYIKRTGVELLSAEYTDRDSALKSIAGGVADFYSKEYAELSRRNAASISKAAAELQRLYDENFFPYMKVRWDTYAYHSGHLYFTGRFRCHGGLHTSTDGRTISNDCGLCHTILEQGPAERRSFAAHPEGLEFEHPVPIGDAWRSMSCDNCHTGALP